MPAHDWSRVGAGVFHAFHVAWMSTIQDGLNNGVLPPDYYALAEQVAGSTGPDVLTLQSNGVSGGGETEMDEYVLKQKTLVIRHSSNDRIVALIEIVSPGNKASRHALRSFVNKTAEALYRGYHLLIVDLHPTGPRDPQGIHGAIWGEVGDELYQAPPDKPLTLAAYSSGQIKKAYVEPFAIGDVLVDMPLFLDPEEYVNVPLEMTYQAAYRGVPQRWRRVLEGPAL